MKQYGVQYGMGHIKKLLQKARYLEFKLNCKLIALDSCLLLSSLKTKKKKSLPVKRL